MAYTWMLMKVIISGLQSKNGLPDKAKGPGKFQGLLL